ncbi:class I SAM-dependent methyltransferase [Alteromonas sp. C1M14]|uniref:class I SAM-dependent methyltransferase n=1 Tax=Alteromonas sp. C1M14 TaxID=2841567 RepID=UPI001C09C49A|nr:class I SAM-dependent methyltransferase [Alteromonas sp. C1M14]MBU2978456.1 class I SAM-dependent methyltransferase [Alteromonas sp. C1M14]
MTTLTFPCPLCASDHILFYHEDKFRPFFQCQQCKLVFAHPQSLPSLIREKREYDLHENHAEDEGYCRFLRRAITPVLANVSLPAQGLDFGCGPTAVLAGLLEQEGYSMTVFDPIYANDSAVLNGRHYDFITCTEAIEHFHTPAKELHILNQLIKPGGLLVFMTKRVTSLQGFSTWHYKNDQTHVSFFSDETFFYLGKKYGFEVTLSGKDIVLLKKRP